MEKKSGALTKKLKPKIKHGALITEFKAFILRGNVIDLAVGVIIGAAFNKIITSFVNDVVMPLVSLVVGRGRFGDMFIALDGKTYANAEAAAAANVSVINYGNLISTVLDFVLMGLVIFAMVKIISVISGRLEKPDVPEEVKEPETKACPFCVSEIHINATVCPRCTSKLD